MFHPGKATLGALGTGCVAAIEAIAFGVWRLGSVLGQNAAIETALGSMTLCAVDFTW